jgi:small-conductance mechanosensitive channel
MRNQIVKIKVVWFLIILMASFIMPHMAIAVQKLDVHQDPRLTDAGAPLPLSFADLIPASTELSRRLSTLERNIIAGLDLSAVEENLTHINRDIEALSARLIELKAAEQYSYEQLIDLNVTILKEDRSFQKIWKSLTERVTQVGLWSKEWSDEKTRWKALESTLSKEVSSSTTKIAIAKAQETIGKAKKIISSSLKPLLAVERKAAEVSANITSLTEQIDGLIRVLRGDLFRKSSPSMFSAEYYSQFHRGLWKEIQKGLGVISWHEWQMLQRNGLIILLQIFFSLVLAVIILRNRRSLATEERLRFVSERPFTTGVFAVFLAFLPLQGTSMGIWRMVSVAVLSIAIARLATSLIDNIWRRQAVRWMAILLVINELLQILSFPRPLFRLYVLLIAMIGLFVCGWRVLNSTRSEDLRLYWWTPRLGVIIFAAMLIAEMGGYSPLAAHLLEASLKTIFAVLTVWILMLLAQGGLDWTFHKSPLTKVSLLRKNADVIVPYWTRFFNLFLGGLAFIQVVVIWGLYESNLEVIRALLSIKFTIGSWQLTIGIVLIAVVLLYGSLIASRAIQKVLMEEVFPRRKMERGAQISMGRLIHYGFVLAGFLFALAALGVDLKNITIIGGALGVGIGFGLQTIVNNFICGIILLFERPIKTGDYIELGGQFAEIKEIGLRSTTVHTFDRADIVVPNADLITNQVINWTRSDRLARIRIPVGVAYGSDVTLVMKILLACMEENSSVMRIPEPRVYFMGFGESSLDFQLRFHLSEIDNWYPVQSDLLQEIDRKFRLEGIEIPFPQRDLHVRSVDESAALTLVRT